MLRIFLALLHSVMLALPLTAQTSSASQEAARRELTASNALISEAKELAAKADELINNRRINENLRSQYFSEIAINRKKILKIIPELNVLDKELEEKKTSLEEEKSNVSKRLEELKDIKKMNEADLQKEVDRANAEIASIRAAISDKRSERDSTTDPAARSKMTGELNDLQRQLRFAGIGQRQALEKQDLFERIDLSISEKTVELNNITSNTIFFDHDELRKVKRKLENARELMDDLASVLLDAEKARNEFTLYSTGVFSALVGAVICLFFYTIITKDDVRKSVFTGDAAIQFVTIFSLVIAIILFGILRILEGKELAALLGGLSGYILGRGSISRQPQPQQ